MDLSDVYRVRHHVDACSLMLIFFGICTCPKFQERVSSTKKTTATSRTPLGNGGGGGLGVGDVGRGFGVG